MTAIPIEVAGVQLRSAADASKRTSMVLWGPAGVGKTVYACSAPGTKLLINLDPDGPSSLGSREDVLVLDFSPQTPSQIVAQCKAPDPFGIERIMKETPISTVIFDSMTALTQATVAYAVSQGLSGSKLEKVSPGGYAARNSITLLALSSILRITNKLDKHVIFITHEDKDVDKEGNFLNYTLMLGGKLSAQVTLQISEVWHMNESDNKRTILVRPGRNCRTVKTRMFNTTGNIEIVCKYEQHGKDAPYGKHSIASFIEEYEANGRNKIQVPR